ncbi:hypothetical protein C8J55DRAFT_565608 [Lentinula edodes]|uniref:Uncharacterized protein n=1 Tax=Lentinula lateritia TaxID=40482 RepID=A0A9W8ZVC6_9AGAR|nr:hypothetical protein C8J55DRAFT_565608 [Lentinula edodes]
MNLLKIIKRTAGSDGRAVQPAPTRRFPIHEVQAGKEWNSSHLYPESRKQHLLHQNHILIRNCEPPDQSELAFNDSTFAEHIGGLNEMRTLHDSSAVPDCTQAGKIKPSLAHMPGTFVDIIQAAATLNGKILNCLDIPLSPDVFPPPGRIATDSIEGQFLKKSFYYCKRWALTATSFAVHTSHVDLSGFLTYVWVLVGAKYWIIGVPKRVEDLGNISAFGKGYQLDMSNDQDWDIYGIILHPGDTLNPHQHDGYIQAKADALVIAEWVYSHFDISLTGKTTGAAGLRSLMEDWVVTQCKALILHKLNADSQMVKGETKAITPNQLRKAIEKQMAGLPWFVEKWPKWNNSKDIKSWTKDWSSDHMSYAWPSAPQDSHFVVEKLY